MATIVDYIERFYSGASIREISDRELNTRDARIMRGSKRMDFGIDERTYELTSTENFTNFDRKLIDTARQRFDEYAGEADDENLVEAIIENVFDGLVIENFFFFDQPYIDRDLLSLYRRLLSALISWRTKTYENRSVSFGVVVDYEDESSPSSSDEDAAAIIRSDYMAPLSDGMTTFLRVSRFGKVKSIEQVDHFTDSTDLPYRFSSAREFRSGKVMILTRVGDVLLISENRLRYVKKGHQWIYYNSTKLAQRLCGNLGIRNPELRKAVYATCLDVALAKTGAVIGIVADSFFDIGELVSREILENREYMVKTRLLSQLVNGRKFHDIDRAIRKELASIDGSLIITNEGDIVGIGTIVKIEGGSLGGGRTAAAIILSRYGAGIKVSSDGYISLYRNGENTPVMRIE